MTGPGDGGGPHVRVFDPKSGDVVANFMAADPSTRNGSSGRDRAVTDDSQFDLMTATGTGDIGRFDGQTFEPVTVGSIAAVAGVNVTDFGLAAPTVSAFDDAPVPKQTLAAIQDCTNNPGGLIQAGTPAHKVQLPAITQDPIRYQDGVPFVTGYDLDSDGFGAGWGQTRSWTTDPGYADRTTNGNSWVDTQQPYALAGDSGAVLVVVDGYQAIQFDSVMEVDIRRPTSDNSP